MDLLELVRIPTICSNLLDVVNNLTYIGCLIITSGGIGKIKILVVTLRADFMKLQLLLHRHAIRPSSKGRVQNATIRRVLYV